MNPQPSKIPAFSQTSAMILPSGIGYHRRDALDPLPMGAEWPSLRGVTGRVDIHALASCFVRESKLSGAYFEFGVANGRSAIAAIRANRRDNPGAVSPFLLFDSFEGLPPLTGPDADSAQFKPGDSACSVDQVVSNLELYGVYNESEVHLVPGWFDSSLPSFPWIMPEIKKAAIVHVNVGLYSSCVTALDFITPYLRVGTVILFDDWNAFSAARNKGERAATAEWLERHLDLGLNEFAAYSWHGRAFIVDSTSPL